MNSVETMNDVIEGIRGKLSRGEELTPEDLQLLQPLHYHGLTTTTIPYLNRPFLNNDISSCHGKGPQLVRYVGMVQDMLDPEYYTIKDSKGRSTHFQDDGFCFEDDSCSCEDDIISSNRNNNNINNNTKAVVVPVPVDDHESIHLAERTPLVVVPIPFASEWFRQGIQQQESVATDCDSKSSSPKSVTQLDPPRKRERDTSEDMEDDRPTNHSFNNTTKQVKSKSSDDGDAVMDDSDAATSADLHANQDWWPAGTCGTSPEDCPVLAKFSYDQLLLKATPTLQNPSKERDDTSTQRRLLLNDLVSVVGVLSMNPWEADFSNQQTQADGTNCAMDEWMSGGWGGDAFATTLPPPSRLPRLHVLSYQILNLDSLTEKIVMSQSTMHLDMESDGAKAQYCPERFVNLFKISGSTPKPQTSLAQALWMCLLSKADRRSNGDTGSKQMIHVGPMERVLGCMSLQVSMPDRDRSRVLFQHLAKNVLPLLCPVVATLDCTQTDDLLRNGLGPSKDSNGRLKPSALQLPAGSVLLVHYQPTGSSVDGRIKAVLQELVQHHRLSYRFEGGVILPFEAEYQIIVVTTQTQQFPCTVSVLSKESTPDVEWEPGSDSVLRKMLCRARNNLNLDGSKSELTLSSSLMERAQQYFLSRRRAVYEAKQQQQSSSPPSPDATLPGEDDFHRWLNTTKLLAKSRICSNYDQSAESSCWEATINDWEAALALDGTMK
jgi:Mini-chromosome maintenance replisome factor